MSEQPQGRPGRRHGDCRCAGAASTAGLSRRMLLNRVGMGLGGLALADLLRPARMLAAPQAAAAQSGQAVHDRGVLGGQLHVPATAKRVIYLFMAGGPSQIETFDHKPLLQARNGEQLPDSVRQGQRLTGMSGNQSSLPLAGAQFGFAQHGRNGTWVSDLLPHTAGIVDDLCIVRSMFTEAINHDPAITFFQTGSQLSGRPSIGAWVDYGLGSDNENLPAFVVLITKGKGDQPLYARLWGSGFLPSRHQGVQFRSGRDPVLYLANPAGVTSESRRLQLDRLRELQELGGGDGADDALDTRIAQYEMAYRMQTSVPEVMDTSGEPDSVFELYGPDARTPGTFAANCLLARRLAERGVKFIQLYHQGWDQHGNLPKGIRTQCCETDQPSAALVEDLRRRSLLDDTLVVWGGEFGRLPVSQKGAKPGRDHNPHAMTYWLAGAGVRTVARPVEGTILTVAKEVALATEAALPSIQDPIGYQQGHKDRRAFFPGRKATPTRHRRHPRRGPQARFGPDCGT